MSTRTTLKTHFVTGATPTEAQFADLIDSTVNVTDDLTASLALDDATKVLTADGAKTLKDALDLIDVRVDTLEAGEVEFAGDYYNKTEIDSRITNVGLTIDSVDATNDAVAAAIAARVTALESADAGFAALVHAHVVSDVTGLQTALDAKATSASLTSEVSTINTAMLGKADSVHTHVMADITDLASIDLSLYATLVQLAGKADTGHTHTYSNITDIGDGFYTKSQVDTAIALVDTEHTHTEVDITDLDKYTQAQTNLRVSDHGDLSTNPHSVTSTQVGLGSVENLDPSGIFASAAATTFVTSNVTPVSTDLTTHEADQTNPHAVTKAQVGLTNVPDVDVDSLLATHLAASNPHSIDLTFFDVFSQAETNARVDYYINAKIYNFTPASPSDGAGAVGDITYNSTKFHAKVASASWLSFYDTDQVDADIATVQADVDQNESDADTAIAAVQSDVDQNESDADTAIAAVQSDVDQNETDADAAIAALSSSLTGSIATAISDLIDAAPAALDTLNELAAAINDDATFHTSIINAIAAVQTDVNNNESDADTAIAAVQTDVDGNETAANTAIAAVQTDVDGNETAANTAIAAVQTDVDNNEVTTDAHEASTSNPHSVTASQVGLGSASNHASIPAADFIDEDDMATDSATKVPSQQSVKAYVDDNAYSV